MCYLSQSRIGTVPMSESEKGLTVPNFELVSDFTHDFLKWNLHTTVASSNSN